MRAMKAFVQDVAWDSAIGMKFGVGEEVLA